MTAPDLLARQQPTSDDDDLHHLVCECDENTSLCGEDMSDVEFLEQDPTPRCVVCDDLLYAACQRCGT